MMERPCMRRFIECEDDGEPVLREEETIDLKMPGVELTFEKEIPAEVGTLYITTSRVIWMSETLGYDFDVPYIMLHAITHDPESYPKPCLYCQLDEDEDGPSELFLVPPKEEDLQTLFDYFSHAAMSNPDPMEEDDDEQGLIYNIDEVELGAQQAAMLAHFESVFRAPGEVFENDDNAGQYDDVTDDNGAAAEDENEVRGATGDAELENHEAEH